jgi:hypothetical protein
MRRVAVIGLLAICFGAAALPTRAQRLNVDPSNPYSPSVEKQKQQIYNKTVKDQQKMQKKNEKAQRKAAKKQQKEMSKSMKAAQKK